MSNNKPFQKNKTNKQRPDPLTRESEPMGKQWKREDKRSRYSQN